jgi:membrane protease YdiL (CAAX protease family)
MPSHNFETGSKIYIGLIITLAILAAINVFLPQGSFLPILPEQELPAPKPVLAIVNAAIMLILYGGLGFLGLKLSQKLGFADIWDSKISNKQRFFIPALIGIGIGAFFILGDIILSQFHALGPLPHPPFPTSLVTSAVAGIGEELIFRLFFISFWMWLISYVILKKRWQNQIFWIVAVLSALAFALGHIPSVMILLGLNTVNEIPFALMTEIILLNGVVSLFAAYYFRKFGFLAPVGIHFWTDVVWHVIWGLI